MNGETVHGRLTMRCTRTAIPQRSFAAGELSRYPQFSNVSFGSGTDSDALDSERPQWNKAAGGIRRDLGDWRKLIVQLWTVS